MRRAILPALLLLFGSTSSGSPILADRDALAATGPLGQVGAAPAGPLVDPSAPFTPKVKSLLPALNVDEKLSLVRGNGFDLVNFVALDPGTLGQAGYLAGVPRLGIPSRRDADALGINVWADATAVPTRLGVAASLDRTAVARLGRLEGLEGRALGVDLLYGPQVDLDRIPDFSRAMTTYGEDPYLSSQLAVGEVGGVQSQGLMDEVKHFAFYNGQNAQPAAVGGATPSIVDDQVAHELYLAPFEAAVREGQPSSVMCSYASFEIMPLQSSPAYACENPLTLNTILRGQWGFTGFVLSDYGATHSTSILQGLDQSYPGFVPLFPPFDPGWFGPLLKPLVDPSSPSYDPAYAAALDRSVARVLYELERFGLLSCASAAGPILGCTLPARPVLDKTADAAVSERLAEEAAVLLKNDDRLLPLRPDVLRRGLAVIGPTSYLLPASPGGERARGFADRNMISPLAALQRLAPSGSPISFAPGLDRIGTVVPASAVPGGWSRQQNGTAAGTDPVLDFTAANPLTPGVDYSWSGTLEVPADDTYALWLQSSAGAVTAGGRVNSTAGGPTPLGGGTSTLAVDGAAVALSPPSTIVANTYPGGDTVAGQHLGVNNWGAYVRMSAGPHTITVTESVPANAVLPAQFRLAWSPVQKTIDDAAAAARKAAVAVVFVDDANATSPLGAVNPLGPFQDQLVEAVAAANPNTAVVLNTGNPVLMPWLSKVKSLIEMWYPGQEGGTATAKLLLGQADPGGKVPITFPASDDQTPFAGHPERIDGSNGVIIWSEGMFMGYRWYDQQDLPPLFPFGFGLSYTKFDLSKLRIAPAADGGFDVRVRVRNTGPERGAEAPQVYVGPSADVPNGVQQAVRKLVQFERVELDPGQAEDLTLHVDPHQLSYWSSEQQRWVLAGGTRQVFVGTSSRDLPLQGSVDVNIGG
jgi:beta-glucosidase